MKKIVICSAISVTLLLTGKASQAGTSEAKQGLIFGGSALLGAAAGGPVGFIAGAVAGALISEDIKHGDQAKVTAANSQRKITDLEKAVAMNEALIESHTQAQADTEKKLVGLLQNLPGEVFFDSNDDQLTSDGLAIIEVLAEVIKHDKVAAVELVGHTDPRGTDEYNNVLSQYRAKAVAEQLVQLGIEPDRISTRGEGSNL